MRSKIIFLMLLIFTSMASAYTQKTIGFNFSSRTEKSIDQDDVDNFNDDSVFARVSTRHPKLLLQYDFHYLTRSTAEGSLKLDYKRYEINSWAIWDINPQLNWHWYFAPGLGLSKEKIKMEVQGIDSSDSDGDIALSILGQAGVFTHFFEVLFSQLSIELHQPVFRKEKNTETLVSLTLGYSF